MGGPIGVPSGRIVIIGGGVVGLSIAYHLASSDRAEVTVLERGLLGEGSTAKATGGIRQQFSTPTNALISRDAVDYFEHFEERVGEKFAFRQHGYLFTTTSPERLRAARAGVAMQQGLGIDSRVVGPAEISELHPQLRVDDLVGGTYCPTDGSGSPADLVQVFARQARKHGADIHQHCEVRAIHRRNDGTVSGVSTTDGRLSAEIVIDAAGPWAAAVAAMAGVDVPLNPTPRQAFAIAPMPWLSADLPLTVDLDSGAYLHPERSGGIIGGTDRDRPPSFDLLVDESRLETLIPAISWRIPALADARILRGWVGLREMTPDDHALVGPVTQVPGLWLAMGFSGHGFLQSPVIGREISAWLLTGSPTIDLSGLDPGRFAEGRAVSEGLVF